jgi:long-chain fatty acid transport protein
MKNRTTHITLAALGVVLTTPAFATNGDNLIGIGPISRAMGGTGIAAPQDAISAVFSNPAAMCISPTCSAPQADFALTAFMPEVNARLNMPGMPPVSGASKDTVFPIPAMGLSLPLGGDATRWRGGFAIYGVSGLGVDYKGTAIAPFIAAPFTELQIMKMAPSIAYSITPDLSVGMSLHADYATLDLGNGTKNDWGAGIQVGMTWKPVQDITVGLTYTSGQETKFRNVAPHLGLPNLTLEAPQQVGLGVAWTGMDDRLLIEIDGKWINWADSTGYEMFEWDDQWTIGIGVQYEAIPGKLFLRAGYNYGKNPVSQNSFNDNMSFGMETLRNVGFPAVVEHHLGLGFGYQVRDDMTLNVAYVHAFEQNFTEYGTLGGQPASIHSDLSEDSVDIGLTWRF